MLTLVYGTDWVENRNYILQMLGKDVLEHKSGRILLVPELISHDMERRLCAAAGNTCSRYAEVLSFSRLTRRVCDWYGCGVEECLDNGGRLVAMAAAARQLHSKLKAFASVETKPEFLSGMIDAIDEFKRCCITSADLSNAAKATEGAFAQKLEELAMLLEAYDAICQQSAQDPRDLLTWGLELLQDCDFAQKHVFYIDGFPDFTVQNLSIIAHLIAHSQDVVISMNCDQPGSDKLAFSKSGDTAQKLLRIAQKNGITTKLHKVEANKEHLIDVSQRLFQGKIKPAFAEKSLRTAQAGSVYDECVLAVEEILSYVHSGSRYRDISLVCPDLPTYQNALKIQLQQCGIPYYIAGKEDILEKPVVSTVITALDAVINGFQSKDILRYLKSSLSALPLDACDKLENYALKWEINGKKWLSDWTMHPEGLTELWTEQNAADLKEINASRALALTPLHDLYDRFHQATHLSQLVQAIYLFLEDIQLGSRLSLLAQELDGEGDNRSAQILNQLWDILLSALEQLDGVLGQTHWDSDAFLHLFKLLLSQYDVGTIPTVLDALMIGSVGAMRCQEAPHLVVIGACEGKFPGYGASAGVLTDQERKTLREMGVSLTGGAAEGLEIEFSEIYGVFCGASQSAYVSCLKGQTSFVYRRLSEMAGGEFTAENVLGASAVNTMEAASYLARRNAPYAAVGLNITDQLAEIQAKSSHHLGAVSKASIQRLYGNKLNLSASQVDKQADCRFAYFLKYGLRLKEQKPATVDPAEFGTYVHAVLEETAKEICKRGGFKAVTLEETFAIAKEYSDAYTQKHFSQIDSQRIAYLFQRNHRELMMVVEELWNEFQQSSFSPVAFELAFGEGAPMPAIQIPGKQMDAQLRGYVDRVDSWKEDGRNYFRVVDYKTGKKDFDYCDVFNGLGLQMLLYLFALEQNGEPILGENPIPAGVQYFPARAPMVSADGSLTDEEAAAERRSLWKRRGLILRDDDVLYAMEDNQSPVRLSIRRKKDGSISGDAADREQFKLLSRYVFSLLGEMVDEIASGNVSPNPYTRGSSHNACRFCPYGAVCHASTVEDRRNYKMMSSQRFWDEVTEEVGKHE